MNGTLAHPVSLKPLLYWSGFQQSAGVVGSGCVGRSIYSHSDVLVDPALAGRQNLSHQNVEVNGTLISETATKLSKVV